MTTYGSTLIAISARPWNTSNISTYWREKQTRRCSHWHRDRPLYFPLVGSTVHPRPTASGEGRAVRRREGLLQKFGDFKFLHNGTHFIRDSLSSVLLRAVLSNFLLLHKTTSNPRSLLSFAPSLSFVLCCCCWTDNSFHPLSLILSDPRNATTVDLKKRKNTI